MQKWDSIYFLFLSLNKRHILQLTQEVEVIKEVKVSKSYSRNTESSAKCLMPTGDGQASHTSSVPCLAQTRCTDQIFSICKASASWLHFDSCITKPKLKTSGGFELQALCSSTTVTAVDEHGEAEANQKITLTHGLFHDFFLFLNKTSGFGS